MEFAYVLIFTYQYWAVLAVLLLNWLLSRALHDAVSARTLLALNVGLSLLLLGPVLASAGFFGRIYVPWYLAVTDLRRPQFAWLATGALCAISLVTTAFCLARKRA